MHQMVYLWQLQLKCVPKQTLLHSIKLRGSKTCCFLRVVSIYAVVNRACCCCYRVVVEQLQGSWRAAAAAPSSLPFCSSWVILEPPSADTGEMFETDILVSLQTASWVGPLGSGHGLAANRSSDGTPVAATGSVLPAGAGANIEFCDLCSSISNLKHIAFFLLQFGPT
jgi:hypothetical protein